jgi:ribonucleotide reductase beta subunit family protein with ferritin-like domain
MATSQTNFSGGLQTRTQVPDDMIAKVGAAVGRVALIQQAFAERMHAESRQAIQQDLVDQAQQEAVAAIDAEGLSVEDYNAVVTAAEDDPALEKRLLSAAREVL